MDLHISLTGERPVSAQVYRQIRDAILEGRLRAHEALPPSRELAQRLQLSRNTVLVVYDRLRAEGFLESRAGAGMFVSAGIRTRPSAAPAESPLRPRSVWDDVPQPPDMSATRPDYDFRPGVADARRFPFVAWRARVARQLHPRSIGTGAHIDPAGVAALRAAIARHIGVSRGVRVAPADVFVTSGSQQAIDLITRVLVEPGDGVGVEDPGYALPRRVFQTHGCRVTGVPVDAEGLRVDAIPEGTRLLYLTPSHQYPLGMAMSMSRRQALLAWAQRANACIIEDDYDSEFRYAGRPLEPLQSLDVSGRVLYIGSFSKVLLPTLRLGFLVAPASLHEAFRKAKFVADWHTAVPAQAALAQFIEDGVLARHIRRMRSVYSDRHDRIVRILERDFDGRLSPLPAAGGLHLTALLAGPATADRTVVERARAAGVAVQALSRHHVDTPPRSGLLLGYGGIATDRIAEGLHRLRDCL